MVERIDFHVGYDWSNGGAPFVEKKVHEHGTYIRFSDYEAALARAEVNGGEPVAWVSDDHQYMTMNPADAQMHIMNGVALKPLYTDAPQPSGPVQAVPSGWQPMGTAPQDGTRILAVLYREACEDMDGIRRKAFTEV